MDSERTFDPCSAISDIIDTNSYSQVFHWTIVEQSTNTATITILIFVGPAWPHGGT